MPGAGAVQVTWVAEACLQVEGGSRPWAWALLFVTMIAFISALVAGFGFGGIDGIVEAPACEPEPLRPAQMPTPARSTTAAASAASQRGCRYQRGPFGWPGGGGVPAPGWPASGWL